MRLFNSETDSSTAVRPHNRLLSVLPPEEMAMLQPLTEPIDFERRQLLYDPERHIEYVWFLDTGIISIVSVLGDGSAVETLTIGVDGMVGMPIFHGVDVTAEQAMVQVPGSGCRIPAAAFRKALASMPTLSALLHRYAAFTFTLTAQNSACNRKHSVEERCARWLLTVHDRIDGDQLGLTHEFISQMLGVRRASVTDTLSLFERRGYIATGRNRISVTDRSGLVATVCECYRIITAAYDRLLGAAVMPSPLSLVQTSKNGYSTVGDGTPIAASPDGVTIEEMATAARRE